MSAPENAPPNAPTPNEVRTTPNEEKKPHRLQAFFDALKPWQGAAPLLASLFAGLTYAFGYGVWDYWSWRNNLGFLPALQPQYFVAGCLPLFILLMATASNQWCALV